MSNQLSDEIRQKVGQVLLESLQKGEVPVLQIPKTGSGNTIYDRQQGVLVIGTKMTTKRVNDISEVKRIAQLTTVARILTEIIDTDDIIAARGLYYAPDNVQIGKTAKIFEDESDSNKALNELEVLLGKFREELHVAANSKGAITGRVKVKTKTVSKTMIDDCSQVGGKGYALPGNMTGLEITECKAGFVLVVEKDTIYEKLRYAEVWDKLNCIICQAEGMPDRITRFFVRKVSEEYKLPVVILTDNDPYGWYIHGTYKFGSMNLAFESQRLACPWAQFLGLSTSDIDLFKLPPRTLEDASETDIARANELLTYDWFSGDPFWKREIDAFLVVRKKSKIDGLAGLGHGFLQTTYLPTRLKQLGLI